MDNRTNLFSSQNNDFESIQLFSSHLGGVHGRVQVLPLREHRGKARARAPCRARLQPGAPDHAAAPQRTPQPCARPLEPTL